MYIFLAAILGMVFLQAGAHGLRAAEQRVGRHEVMDVAIREARRYRDFVFAASRVMTQEPLNATGSVQTRTWAQMQASPHMPQHLKGVAMPSNWVVRGDGSEWVVCAPLSSEATVPLLAAHMRTAPGGAIRAMNGTSGKEFYVMGEPDENQRAKYTGWCSLP